MAKKLLASDPRHGTPNGYHNLKCRCVACKTAWAIYWGAQRRKRAALGICLECAQPSRGFARCEKHRAVNNAYNAERARRIRAVAPRASAEATR